MRINQTRVDFISTVMTAPTKKTIAGTKSKAQTRAGTTRTRTQTERGKYNARGQKQKRIAERSESEESSEEETQQPYKKRSKLAEDTDSGCNTSKNTSNIESVVEVSSGNGSESDFQVSIWHSLLPKTLPISNM